ncbi:hypothetical protein D3C80_1705160 [compost metagenome]
MMILGNLRLQMRTEQNMFLDVLCVVNVMYLVMILIGQIVGELKHSPEIKVASGKLII